MPGVGWMLYPKQEELSNCPLPHLSLPSQKGRLATGDTSVVQRGSPQREDTDKPLPLPEFGLDIPLLLPRGPGRLLALSCEDAKVTSSVLCRNNVDQSPNGTNGSTSERSSCDLGTPILP
jgi:hypothetical protein